MTGELSLFQDWDNYFLMLGSAAGGLIGLLFVVVTLTAGVERERAMRGQKLYMTPTALNFAVVLTTSAIALAPHLPPFADILVVGAAALLGVVNAVSATLGIYRLRDSSNIHWTDMWFYGVTPTVVYASLAIFDACVAAGVARAVYGVAAMLLGLLLIGIRNAWDLVTWMAPAAPKQDDAKPPQI